MGYTTTFEGQIDVTPALDAREMAYLNKFTNTRRMMRKNGPYFVGGGGFHGQAHEPDIVEYNEAPQGQPGLWCGWVPSDDGSAIIWNGSEKFYDSAEWMLYIVNHFLRPGALAVGHVMAPGIRGGHELNGTLKAQGDNEDDKWDLLVQNNKVFVVDQAGSTPVLPTPYTFLYSPRVKQYMKEIFGSVPEGDWKQADILADDETGAPLNVMRVHYAERIIAYQLTDDNRLVRQGPLEWVPEE